MAKGNWKPNVIKPKTRCRYCGIVIHGKMYYADGYKPCHKECADRRGISVSEEMERVKHTEIELTDSVIIKVD